MMGRAEVDTSDTVPHLAKLCPLGGQTELGITGGGTQ